MSGTSAPYCCGINSAAVYPFFFFFNDTATTEIYTLSLHDALPISRTTSPSTRTRSSRWRSHGFRAKRNGRDRKSTRLNSSHVSISYAVFCLKKKSVVLTALAKKLFIFESLARAKPLYTLNDTNYVV